MSDGKVHYQRVQVGRDFGAEVANTCGLRGSETHQSHFSTLWLDLSIANEPCNPAAPAGILSLDITLVRLHRVYSPALEPGFFLWRRFYD
jgi:hypothetical protein